MKNDDEYLTFNKREKQAEEMKNFIKEIEKAEGCGEKIRQHKMVNGKSTWVDVPKPETENLTYFRELMKNFTNVAKKLVETKKFESLLNPDLSDVSLAIKIKGEGLALMESLTLNTSLITVKKIKQEIEFINQKELSKGHFINLSESEMKQYTDAVLCEYLYHKLKFFYEKAKEYNELNEKGNVESDEENEFLKSWEEDRRDDDDFRNALLASSQPPKINQNEVDHARNLNKKLFDELKKQNSTDTLYELLKIRYENSELFNETVDKDFINKLSSKELLESSKIKSLLSDYSKKTQFHDPEAPNLEKWVKKAEGAKATNEILDSKSISNSSNLF